MTPQASISITSRLGVGDERALADDVLDGLTRPFKELPPKHLYDREGSRLFELICAQPEYYPTVIERAILRERASDIAQTTHATELLELGSGNPTKTRVLLDALHSAGRLERYLPFDVSEDLLRTSAEQLVRDYPGLHVSGIVGDFERHLSAVPRADGPRIVALLGGTIGNFIPGSRRRFLRAIGRTLRPHDRLLLGLDLVKDPVTLEAAYNDARGVTAAFNLNLLRVLNRELDADFALTEFEHVAFYDRQHEWIEMRLRALRPQVINVEALSLTVRFAPREELRTEISAKFTPQRLQADLSAAGLKLERLYTDAAHKFALCLSSPAAS